MHHSEFITGAKFWFGAPIVEPRRPRVVLGVAVFRDGAGSPGKNLDSWCNIIFFMLR